MWMNYSEQLWNGSKRPQRTDQNRPDKPKQSDATELLGTDEPERSDVEELLGTDAEGWSARAEPYRRWEHATKGGGHATKVKVMWDACN